MKFILTLFLIISSTLAVRAEVINDIIVKNNDRISINTIKTYGDIKIGVDYSSDDLNNILKNLYETNFFKDISLKIEKNILVIDVMENKLKKLNLNNSEKIDLFFSLGKAYEDLKDFDKSFHYLKKGNNLKKQISKYKIEKDEQFFKTLKDFFKNIMDRKYINFEQ